MAGGAGSADGPIGLVLAGGGARGAYEIGALSALLPALEKLEKERPRVIVGTSVGALNAAFLAGTADRPVEEVVELGLEIWSEISFEQVLEPLASPGTLKRAVEYVGQFLGVKCAHLEGLLSPRPLHTTVKRDVRFAAIEHNVGPHLDAAAVVATSAFTGRSVVFHRGGRPLPARDDAHGIDYVETPLAEEHVLASAAIPVAFPAVHVSSPGEARGWYFDGGTRLNTPIKPALKLGARRIVVVALNAIQRPTGPPPVPPPPLASDRRPDALEGAAQIAQGLFADPLANDIATLASRNAAGGPEVIPYIFVGPDRPDAIGRCAREVFKTHYAHLCDALRSCDLAFLGRMVDGGADAMHGELLSYLFFAPEFARELIRLGHDDAERWLREPHTLGLWET